MKASGILAIAGRVRDGVVYTKEVLREFAETDWRLEFDEESGELLFDGYFHGDELSRLRKALRTHGEAA